MRIDYPREDGIGLAEKLPRLWLEGTYGFGHCYWSKRSGEDNLNDFLHRVQRTRLIGLLAASRLRSL